MEAEQVWRALRQVNDPELGINIVDLGLVYDVQVNDGNIRVALTMTTPACPLHTYLTSAAESAIWQKVPGAKSVDIRLVWNPPWNPLMMTDAAKRQLGWEMAK
jgi:metal-sulfur cluster biosynthetic enzyme